MEELPVAPDELPVGVDLAVTAQIADQVEMEGRAVLAAEGLEAHAEREVHRSPDLLVEEDVAGETIDLVVEPERELADPVGAFVDLQQRAEVLLAARSLRRDHPSVLQHQPCIVDLPAAENRWEPEANRSVDPGLDGARVDLAVGDVLAPVCGAPGAAVDDGGQIRVLADDPQLAYRTELLGPRLQALAHLAPMLDRVVVEHMARPKDEVLVVLQRHVGVLSVAFRRRERPAPAVLATGDPVTTADGDLSLRRQLALPAVGVGTCERARVRFRPDRDRRVDSVHLA